MKTLAAAVLIIALVGCKQAQPPKPQTESDVAPSDLKALAYAKAHNCKLYSREEGHISFDYQKGEPKYHSGFTGYECTNPKLYIAIDDAPVGGSK